MKRTKIYIILIVSLISLNSCNNWLDVTPKGDAKAEDLLTTTSGFNSALAGVYYKLIGTSMYGKNLSYYSIDVLAQYWNIDNNEHTLYNLSKYSYDNLSVKSSIDSWWKSHYEAIAQCNQILEALEENKSNIDTPEIFEGELLALRGFLHLQLYGLFAPVVINDADLDQKSLCYRTKFDNVATEFKTCREFLKQVKQDLSESLKLLENDPIKTRYGRDDLNESFLDYNNLLINRTARFNYYGVMGLLARVEQLSLNQSEEDGAFYWANRIITEIKDKEFIRFATRDEVTGDNKSTVDLMYTSEMISTLYINNLPKVASSIFGFGDEDTNYRTSLFNSDADYTSLVNFVYGKEPDGAGTDYRLNYWFDKNASRHNFLKYRKPGDRGTIYPVSYPEMPIYKLSEAYYTLCEAKIGKDNKAALDYLNKVRSKRGLPDLEESEKDNVEEYLMREMRKEFFGEGRMFFIYKRLFKDIKYAEGKTITATKAIFELPIPEDEYTYGPNSKPESEN